MNENDGGCADEKNEAYGSTDDARIVLEHVFSAHKGVEHQQVGHQCDCGGSITETVFDASAYDVWSSRAQISTLAIVAARAHGASNRRA